MEQVARCNNLIGSKFLIPLFAFFSSPSSSYRVIAKRLKKIVLKNPTSPRYPFKEQALPEESRSFLSIQISRHPRFFHGKWRRKKNRGKSRLAEAAAAHARKESSACVRACVRECVLRVFTAIRVAAEGAARSVAVSPYRFLCNYN